MRIFLSLPRIGIIFIITIIIIPSASALSHYRNYVCVSRLTLFFTHKYQS